MEWNPNPMMKNRLSKQMLDRNRKNSAPSKIENRATFNDQQKPQKKMQRNIKCNSFIQFACIWLVGNFFNVSDWIYKAIRALYSMCKQYDERIFTRIELKCDWSLLQMNVIKSHENDCWQWTLFQIQHPALLFATIICIICGMLVWLITFRIISFL